MSAARKRARGAAAVEMAVTLIVLVPLIMYTLFLEDLLAYKLEAQEPPIVAAWDHAFIDYASDKTDVTRVLNMNQLKYCDHSAAYDSYDKAYDCGTDKEGDAEGMHHEAGTAHQCWLVTGAKQVECAIDVKQGLPSMTNIEVGLWSAAFNRGGQASCTARLAVMNYFLPNKFFEWAGDPNKSSNITSKAKLGGDGANVNSAAESVHKEAKGANGVAGSWLLTPEEFAVLSDPWALNELEDTEPGELPTQMDHPFWQRASVYHASSPMRTGAQDARAYRDSIDELVGANAARDRSSLPPCVGIYCGNDPRSLPLAWKNDTSREFDGHYASGWADQRMSASNRPNAFPSAWGPP